ncbi:MAG: ribosomal-protein-serine acetyltransferase [Oceanospirillaceae bacterium]|jgi:ribosomal-protein-serine acetyltransferase
MFSMKVNEKIDIIFLHDNFKSSFYKLFKSNKLQLLKWFNWPNNCQSEADFSKLISNALFEYARGTAVQSAISYDNELIGYIGLTKVNTLLGKAELSYWISHDYQGRGIMTLVCQKMIHYAFYFLCLDKIETSIATDNISSRKVCEMLDFELEGILKRAENINGKVIDHARYGLLKH